jgi:dihydroorotase
MDQIIEGKAFIDKEFYNCCIGISDGKIIEIKKTINGTPRKTFPKKIILPAGVDIHVHFRDPGLTHKEDFYTGTLSAAYGGISCICDMPNTKPFTSTHEALKQKDRIAQKKSVVDYGLYLGIDQKNIAQLKKFNKDCCGYKLFLGKSTANKTISSENLPLIFKSLQGVNKILAVHAEDAPCLNRFTKQEKSLLDHVTSRPEKCEIKAISNLMKLHDKSKIRLHICHISSATAMKYLKDRDRSISVGVTPHHMFFDIDKNFSSPPFLKVNPPLRYIIDRKYLWTSFNQGKIDVVESDHAPHTLDEKVTNFNESPSGLPGVETMFPILLAKAKHGQISLSTILRSIASRPADIMGIPKGRIAVGNDADFCIVDYNNIQKVKSENLHSKSKWTAYEGFNAIFPSDVLLRGVTLISDYEFVGKKGYGINILRKGA